MRWAGLARPSTPCSRRWTNRSPPAPTRRRRLARAAHPADEPDHEPRPAEEGAGRRRPAGPALVRAAREQAGELDQLVTDLRRPRPLRRVHATSRDRAPGPADRRGGAPRAAAHAAAAIDADLQTVPRLRRSRRGGPRDLQPDRQRDQVESPGGAVQVVVADGRVSVRDHGPGIPTRTSPASSSASTGQRPPEACPARASGWRSWAASRRPTAEHRGTDGPDGSTFTLTFPPHPDSEVSLRRLQG